MRRPAALVLLSLFVLSAAQTPKGVPVNGYPNYAERSLLVWTNMIRLSPDALIDHYFEPSDGSTQGIFAQYTKTRPLHWNQSLNVVARSYANDWASDANCRSSQPPHTSCDGSSFSSRVGGAYDGGGGVSENMFPSNQFPATTTAMHSMRGFVCEGPISSNGRVFDCVPDGDPADGHRRNLMSGSMKEVGMGYAAPGHSTVIQNFGSGAADYPTTDFIYSGAHLFQVAGHENELLFWLNIYNTATPTSVKLVIEDDQAYTMTLGTDLGDANAGTYEYALPLSNGACKYYYFEVDSDRYPATGSFATQYDGSCDEDWVDKDFNAPDAPDGGDEADGGSGGVGIGPVEIFNGSASGNTMGVAVVVFALALIMIGASLFYQRTVMDREDDLDRQLHESLGLKWDGGKRARLAKRREKKKARSNSEDPIHATATSKKYTSRNSRTSKTSKTAKSKGSKAKGRSKSPAPRDYNSRRSAGSKGQMTYASNRSRGSHASKGSHGSHGSHGTKMTEMTEMTEATRGVGLEALLDAQPHKDKKDKKEKKEKKEKKSIGSKGSKGSKSKKSKHHRKNSAGSKGSKGSHGKKRSKSKSKSKSK